MSWHESDDKSSKPDEDDVWKRHQKRGSTAPPDLDKLIGQFFGKLFGGKPSFGSGDNVASKAWLPLILAAVVLIWAVSGIFIVDPAEQAVELHFGRYVRTVGPGPHWIPRIINQKKVVNIQQVHTFSYDADMLTKDKNIVSVSVAVHYRINNTKDYLFNVVNPEASLHQATASALRQVVGTTTLDKIITTGRAVVRTDVMTQLQAIMQRYKSGLLVTDVTMQPARAPEAVKAAFDDAIKALEDEQRFINQAQAYARDVVPKSEGQAKRLQAEAKAYKAKVVFQAQGDTARFLALLPQYHAAPKMLRQRLYIETMQQVLSHNQKVYVGLRKSQPLMYLPLDKLLQQQEEDAPDAVKSTQASMVNNDSDTSLPTRGGYFSEG